MIELSSLHKMKQEFQKSLKNQFGFIESSKELVMFNPNRDDI